MPDRCQFKYKYTQYQGSAAIISIDNTYTLHMISRFGILFMHFYCINKIIIMVDYSLAFAIFILVHPQ